MRFRRTRLAALAAAGLLALGACGRDEPTAPTSHDISGPVVLTGYLTNDAGQFTGTRVVSNATGVPVELWNATGPLARTLTVNGRYRFESVPPGTYTTRTVFGLDFVSQSHVLTMSSTDIAVADTLRLRSLGSLFPVPNPSAGPVTVYYPHITQSAGQILVLDLAGRTVKTLFRGTFQASEQQLQFWDGRDEQGLPVPFGLYWFVLQDDLETRAQLLFHE